MSRDIVYLDYNATAPIKPAVIEEMVRVAEQGGNPSSVHAVGRKAKSVLEQSRQNIAQVINCRSQQITFTSGGTEANNIALKCLDIDRIIISATEHDSVGQIADTFTGQVEIVPCDGDGIVSQSELGVLLENSTGKTLVSIMLANNETGVIQDIKSLCQIAHEYDALFHTDAIQAFGKVDLDFNNLGVDMMSLSSHKIGGPQGIGALVAKESLNVRPLIAGGGQEVGRRSGTENLVGIAGFSMAAILTTENLGKMDVIKAFRDKIETELSRHCNDVIFYGVTSCRLPNTSTILMPDVSSETQVMAFDLDGICISAGSACSSGKVKPSHVVSAMGATEQQALSTIRVSLGWNSTEEEVDRFIASWKKIYDRKRR